MDTAHSAQVISLLTESTTDQAFVLHFVTLVLVCKLLAVGELVVAEVALGGGETLAHAAAARAGLGLALAVCLGELRAVGALVQTRRLSSAVKRSIGFHNHGEGRPSFMTFVSACRQPNFTSTCRVSTPV